MGSEMCIRDRYWCPHLIVELGKKKTKQRVHHSLSHKRSSDASMKVRADQSRFPILIKLIDSKRIQESKRIGKSRGKSLLKTKQRTSFPNKKTSRKDSPCKLELTIHTSFDSCNLSVVAPPKGDHVDHKHLGGCIRISHRSINHTDNFIVIGDRLQLVLLVSNFISVCFFG